MSAPAVAPPLSAVLVVGVIVVIACACGAVAAICDLDLRRIGPRGRRPRLLERQKDIAAGLGWPWGRWITLRLACVALGLGIAAITGITLLYVVGPIAGWEATGFALSGVAAGRRLRMERAFLGQLRTLRDRMAVSNQSLDTALQEIARSPSAELAHILEPLGRGGATVAGCVEMGLRARSPLVEQAAAVLIWARSRSSDFLIHTIDGVLVPVGEAQLAVQEEHMAILTQQRAVTVAMSALLVAMLAVVLRVGSLRAYYQTLVGQIILLLVFALFAVLVSLLGWIVRVRPWTRWDLPRLAEEQERLGG